MYVWMYVFMCVYVCMYVCVCMYVGMYVCMCPMTELLIQSPPFDFFHRLTF